MDRFQEMQVFIRIAERGSFTRAADDLQIPRATVTNLMKRMEERLRASACLKSISRLPIFSHRSTSRDDW
jgi:hypothetical protein